MIRRKLLVVPFALFATAATFPTDPPINCSSCPGWNTPRDPFKVFGNTYYVGTAGLSSLLIAGDQGLILVDGALPQSAPLIIANIEKLGFKAADIKLILTSHAHYDHAGGLRALAAFTKAPVVASEAGARALKLGHPTPDDPQYEPNHSQDFPAVPKVRAVIDGATLRVGKLYVKAHYTPGHTPGATSWTWQSCEGSRCLNIVYADSLTPVARDGFRFADQVGLVDRFRRTFDTVAALPCDIMISTHPSASNLDERLARRAANPDALVDSGACKSYAARARTLLEERIKSEASR